MIDTLRAIIRDELARMRAPELGLVVAVYANDADGNNHQVDVRLRNSGVELKRVPVTVQRYGLSALPREDDLVVVAFLGGDLNAPVVLGSVYDEQLQPPEGAPEEVIYQVPDAGGERHLHLELPSGMSCTFNDDNLEVVAGGTTVLIEQDGNVQVEASGDVSIVSGGDCTLEAGRNLTLKAGVDLSLEGVNIKSQGSAQVETKGAVLKFGGMAQFSPS